MKVLKRILSIEFLVEFILVVFAIANYSTISDYFIHSGMNSITSYAVGVMMGLILIASAMMLSRIEKTSEIFKFVLYSTITAALLAAILQSLAYHVITNDWVTSIIKGSGFPLVEVLLAYSVSLYSTYVKQKEEENKEFNETQKKEKFIIESKEKIRSVVGEAFTGVDIDSIRDRINPLVQQVAFKQAENVVMEMDPTYVPSSMQCTKLEDDVNLIVELANAQHEINTLHEQLKNMQVALSMHDAHAQENKEMHMHDALALDNTGEMHDNNASAMQEKKTTLDLLQEHLAANYNGCMTDALNHAQLASALNVNASTISRNLKKLKEQQKLNGHVDAALLV